jgi:hypothetical protein
MKLTEILMKTCSLAAARQIRSRRVRTVNLQQCKSVLDRLPMPMDALFLVVPG